MRLILPDNLQIAVSGGAALCPATDHWRGLFELCCAGERLACRMEIPEPRSRAETRQRRMMSRSAVLASWVVREALREFEVDDDKLLQTGLFMGVGSSQGSMETLAAMLEPSNEDGEFSVRRFGEEGLAAANPLFAFQLMNNYTMCHAAILEGLGGPNNAFFSQGSGTVAALIEAAQSLVDGEASRVLVGGADSAHHPVTRDENERRGLTERGFVGSEGAAVLALEAASECASPLALLEHAAVYNARRGELESVLGEAASEAGDYELVLAMPWGEPARRALSVEYVDLTAVFGDALAATPALGWLAAVDAIESHRYESVLVLGLGIDGDLTAVGFRGHASCGQRPQGEPEATRPDQHAGRGTRELRPEAAGRARGYAAPPNVDHAVITGVGVVSPFGVGTSAFFDGLSRGETAVRLIESFDVETFETRVAAEVTGRPIDAAWLGEHLPARDELDTWQDSGQLRDRKIGFALLAADDAWRQAGLGPEYRDATLTLGLGLERALLEDFGGGGPGLPGLEALAPNRLPEIRYRVPVDYAARRVADWLGLRGPVIVNTSACAAGALSVAHAASLIRRGAASTVLCGASDSMLNPLGVGGMSRLRAPSPRNSADACRPFDRRRDGLAMGEGAAFFVVESLAQARERGARPLAIVSGWASTQDGFATTKPRPDGLQAALAIQRALERANRTPESVDYINAHGTGTPLNDPAEIAAIRRALGEFADQVPISSIKGATGHAMAASGALELAACLLPFERNMVSGTVNLADPDPRCDLMIIGPQPQSSQARVVLSNSFGFGGQNATVVLERP